MAISQQAQPRRAATAGAGAGTALVPRTGTLITAPDCPPAVVEAYLTLQTNLDFALLGTAGSVVMGVPLEGNVPEAAQVVANLALTVAASGDEVLVVDCNLHEPSMHTVFGLTNDRGVHTLLGREWADHDPIAHAGPLPNVQVITAGPGRLGALSTAATNDLAEVILRVKTRAERTIILGPPVLAYTDSLTLAPYVDGLFVIVPAQGTRRDALRRARALLRRVNAPLVGTVVLAQENG